MDRSPRLTLSTARRAEHALSHRRRRTPTDHSAAGQPRDAVVGVVDQAMRVAAVLHPVSAVPQVVTIYSTHDVTGTSMLTWLFFMAVGVVFLSYSVAHRIRPLMVTQTLWFVNDFLIVGGIL